MSDRNFKVVDVRKSNGCKTKFLPGKYTKSHAAAARKAMTKLCSVKKIKGVCAFYITVKETTRNSSKKMLTYKCMRKKLKNPTEIKDKSGKVLYKVEYEISCKAHKKAIRVAKGANCEQSKGVISRKTKLKRRLNQKGGALNQFVKLGFLVKNNDNTYSLGKLSGGNTSSSSDSAEILKKSRRPDNRKWYKKIFDAIRKKCKRKKKWTQDEVNEMINDVEYVTDLEFKPEEHDYSESSDELMTDKGKLDTGYSSPEQKGCMARCLRKKGKPLRQRLDAMDWQSANEGKQRRRRHSKLKDRVKHKRSLKDGMDLSVAFAEQEENEMVKKHKANKGMARRAAKAVQKGIKNFFGLRSKSKSKSGSKSSSKKDK